MEILNGKITSLNKKEALRYLGYYGAQNIDGLEEVFSECEELALAAISPKAVYAVYDIEKLGGGKLNLGFAEVKSFDLEKNLSGCNKIALFAATVGIGLDRLILKYEKLSPARAVILQAIGAALIEQWCDEVNEVITNEYKHTKPRFSCGYGDLSLSLQKEIFKGLSVTKNIGISLNESLFMTPTKSVTAIVGIANES